MPTKLAAYRGATAKVKRIYLLCAVVLVLAIGMLLNWVMQTQTYIKATSHQPEAYTELYFTDPNSLPSSAQNGQTVPVNFTVHNVESRNMLYTYNIELTTPTGQTTIVSHEQFAVARGDTLNIVSDATLPSSAGRDEVNVVLVGMPESIHYWVEAVS
jgi:hypothetical protein